MDVVRGEIYNMVWGINLEISQEDYGGSGSLHAGLSFDGYRIIPIQGNDPDPIQPVPEPATVLLLGTGLLGLARIVKK